jgi:hypothetical protein
MSRRSLFAGFFALVSVAACATPEPLEPGVVQTRDVGVHEASEIAMQAYVYGYSLITSEVTRVQMSNVAKIEELRAPMNAFVNVKRYPPADFRGISAPNADTLYSVAWLDLAEPIVFTHPDMGRRFFLFEMVDLWMNVFDSPGTRTTGGKAAKYLITGPGWKGIVPAGLSHIPVSTRYMVILGRTYANGSEADYRAVNALQAQFKLTPLSAWGKKFTFQAPPVNADPGFSMTDKPQDVILALGTKGYFDMMMRLMGETAPAAHADVPFLARMSKIGLEPGKPFDMAALDEDVQAALRDLPRKALDKIESNRDSIGEMRNGWVISKGLGVYGTDYMKRAVVAAFGWPANLEKDAVYPYAAVDAEGQKLSGADSYTITFPKGHTPPVNGFWSITMYQVDQGWWFVPNKLDRFTISPRNNPKLDKDGSMTLHFQQASPGKARENNWLPAPEGEFILMLRMYWPKDPPPSILDGSWTPPPVVKSTPTPL